MKEKGKFIIFEGVGGSGKSTQIGRAKEFLESKGIPTVTTREPGGTHAGEHIRDLIFELKGEGLISGDQQLILFFASRYILVKEIGKPNIESGITILSDRLHPSTGAYQGYGEGADMERILKTADVVLKDLKPDAVILFRISAETALERSRKEEDNDPFDRTTIDYFQKVVDGYEEMAKTDWGDMRWYVVDGEKPIEEVFEEVKKVLLEIFDQK